MKKCIRCNIEKPISEFQEHKKVKYVYKHCNKCVDEMEKEYIQSHAKQKK